jgi:hypothetical protein
MFFLGRPPAQHPAERGLRMATRPVCYFVICIIICASRGSRRHVVRIVFFSVF